MKRSITWGLLLLSLSLAVVAQRQSTKYIRSTYLDDGQVLITCKNGADPTGKKVAENSLIVGCGTR